MNRAEPGLCIDLAGRIQGVGFRPFVYKLATRLQLAGDVCNLGARVRIHVRGETQRLDAFVHALVAEAPALARPRLVSTAPWPASALAPAGFRILDSRTDPQARPSLPPDLSLCDDCRREWADAADRRHHHAFINCTQCGPRYTVIRDLPYDRAATSMAAFRMCTACEGEYGDPASRRFHAEPIACPQCGPRLRFEPRSEGSAEPAALQQGRDDASAVAATVAALRRGEIVAVLGIGGYHLMVDAANEPAVQRLRQRKQRPHKPLAVMFPWNGADGLDAVRAALLPGALEARALLDPVRPIVLVRARAEHTLAPAIAPGLDEMGAFLPYSPLHLLLLEAFQGPVVATSGNLSGEPVLTQPDEARARLHTIADGFLHHDRAILRPADDSVVRVVAGQARPLRVGRGLAPLEGRLTRAVPEPTLALGGESKVTIALAEGTRVLLSPHIGDLSTARGREVFAAVIEDFQRLHDIRARRWVVDLHPGYASTRWAEGQIAHHHSQRPAQRPADHPAHTPPRLVRVAHHHAHAACVATEHPAIRSWLALTWDGVGLGVDGELWGGEALWGQPGDWRRVGSWRRFRPLGGDRAAREPWRSAAALLWETGAPCAWPAIDAKTLALAHAAWQRGINAPATSAVGRLLDAAAALVMGLTHTSHEAQGPMGLEGLLARDETSDRWPPPAAAAQRPPDALTLPMSEDAQGVLRIDWAPLLPMLQDAHLCARERSRLLHESIAATAVEQVLRLRARYPFDAVALAGGVFQNRWLSERLLHALQAAGVPAHLPRQVPVNDGGLAWGQIVESATMA